MIVEYVAALCERLGDPGEYAFFFFNDTATTEIYTLSLHDALPISYASARCPETRLEIALTTPKVTMNDTMTVVEAILNSLAPRSGTTVRSNPTMPPTNALVAISNANCGQFSRKPSRTMGEPAAVDLADMIY